MSEKKIYLSFPVVLLKEFKTDLKSALSNVMNYCLYATMLKESVESNEAAEMLKIRFGGLLHAEQIGKKIYESVPKKAPQTSIKKDLLFDFYENEKSDFEVDCFLAFAALKSIVGSKPFCKSNNAFLLARMAGNSNANEDLPEWIKMYQHRYHLNKIKLELQINWNLKLYGVYTRGFFFSFTMALEKLVLEVEKSKQKVKEKNLVQLKKKARVIAIESLTTP